MSEQDTESRESMRRCQLIDSYWRGDGIIKSYDVFPAGKRSYVGIENRVLKFIKKAEETCRFDISTATGIEEGQVNSVVKKLMLHGTVVQSRVHATIRMLKAG